MFNSAVSESYLFQLMCFPSICKAYAAHVSRSSRGLEAARCLPVELLSPFLLYSSSLTLH